MWHSFLNVAQFFECGTVFFTNVIKSRKFLVEQKRLVNVKVKGKVILLQARCGPEDGQGYSSTLP